MNPPVTIIGGGLSGLLVAYRLTQHGIGFKLLEANTRLGGRILSTMTTGSDSYSRQQPAVDLGPSWFWPGQQHLTSLIQELGLGSFVYTQASSGDSVIEYGDGSIVSGHTSASMAGAYRLRGGMYHLIQQLLDSLPAHSVMTGAQVTHLRRDVNGVVAVVRRPQGQQQIHSQQVVLALPPRVVARTIVFEPALPVDYLSSLMSVPTWMAGQAKLAAVYDAPFWRDKGLSGDALSQRGPLVEIHDASPHTGGPYALFGFIGVPAAQRLNRSEQLKAGAVDQLIRLFGEQAGMPQSVHFKDWAFDPMTAIDLDRDSPSMHASGVLDWMSVPGHDIVWAGTESARSLNQSNGYLEGAAEAAERAAISLVKRFETSDRNSSFV
jgi:monoamine oxidase